MKRRILFILLFLAILGGAGWLALRGTREPVYDGHTLTYWLERYQLDRVARVPAPGSQAVRAIRSIGTNGIPTLLRMAQAHDSSLRLKLDALAQKQHLVPIRFSREPQLKTLATDGLCLLGPTASNAVPSLAAVLET
jgi:hypothetical protein